MKPCPPVDADGRPLVSVIMIFYNAGRYISEAIDSVVAQTWPHWELVLVDDGSRDASRQIAEVRRQRLPARIRIIEHPGHANRGMSASRNLGIAASRGEYVTFLDADDIYLPSRLQRHVELLDRFQEAGAVQSCVEYWRSWPADRSDRRRDMIEQPPPVRLEVPVRPPELLLLLLDSSGATAPGICSLTLRRSLVQGIGGSEELFRAHYEDQVLYAKIYLSANVIVIADCLARYRQHAESLTGQDSGTGNMGAHRWQIGRAAFITWLEAWIAERKIENELVQQSLRRARKKTSESRSPAVTQRVLATLRHAAEKVLPKTFATGLIDWWGRRKTSRTARQTARAHARISRKLAAESEHTDSNNDDRHGQ